MQPKIGIVICGLEGNHQFVSNPYIQSVRYSHGLPLLLPLVRSEDLLNQYVSLCDGFLFAEAAISHRSFLVNPLFPGTDVQASLPIFFNCI